MSSNPRPAVAKTLLIEGWRGINHSFALVNQSQILSLAGLPGLALRHRDLPFAYPQWNRTANAAGLPADQQAAIDALPAPRRGERIDAVYRIAAPFRQPAPADKRHTLTFMVTEFGLTAASFAPGARPDAFTRGDNLVTTPSAWSRDRLVEAGVDETRIRIIPHGVDRAVFHPLEPAERAANRTALGIADDETVFLNIGLSSWNKGVDLLLIAFARLRVAGRKVRLILKDQKDLYGRSVETLIRELGAAHPALLTDAVLGAIMVIGTNMGRADLRLLYGIADAYASPYRAEGFNLPVLEAIACGTPVIVTAGGATDAFCTDAVAVRLPGIAAACTDAASGLAGRIIEPDLSTLIDVMAAFAERAGIVGFQEASQAVAARFSWAKAAADVAALTVGLAPAVPAPVAARPPERPTRPHRLDVGAF